MWLETKTRAMLKTISWRFWATITTMALVFLFTGHFEIALAIGGIEVIMKMLLYYLHERTWDKVRFGKKQVKPFVLWFTGLPSSGKSTLADKTFDYLQNKGVRVERIDGDAVRKIFPHTGFSKEERDLHINRIGFLSSMLEKNGVIVIASFVSPYKDSRAFVRQLCSSFHEIFVDTPLDVCESRDTKGLYKKARARLITNFTGINDPYEKPDKPELLVRTENKTIEESSREIVQYVKTLIDN